MGRVPRRESDPFCRKFVQIWGRDGAIVTSESGSVADVTRLRVAHVVGEQNDEGRPFSLRSSYGEDSCRSSTKNELHLEQPNVQNRLSSQRNEKRRSDASKKKVRRERKICSTTKKIK